MRALPFALISLAVIEIMVFMWAGQYIGFWWTILLVLISAFAGAFLVRRQGLQAWADFQRTLATGQGEIGLSIFTGICLLLAGAFLITPGFLTDTLGLLLLIPPLRFAVYSRIKAQLGNLANSSQAGKSKKSIIIDADGQEID